MKYLKWITIIIVSILCIGAVYFHGTRLYLNIYDGNFARSVSVSEFYLRRQTVASAQQWLGTTEGTMAHMQIVKIYNGHTPLAQGYPVKIEDDWCATFVSAVAIDQGITAIVPTECGCERQIGLWMNLGQWVEDETYIPLPGDYIYYAWDEESEEDDCTGWADHVGIVVGTAGPWIKVIEGNTRDMVAYRIIPRQDETIRGYGLPNYAALSA